MPLYEEVSYAPAPLSRRQGVGLPAGSQRDGERRQSLVPESRKSLNHAHPGG